MSVVFSGTYQGVFTSTGGNQILQVPTGIDWINVYNQTQIADNSESTGYQFYWQLGMPPYSAIEWQSNAGGTAVNQTWITTAGFSLVNNTVNNPGPAIAISAITSATPPHVTATANTNLQNGSVVRLFNVAGDQQLGGLDFTVNRVDATHFTLAYMKAANVSVGTTGTYRLIPYDPYFYPPTRIIADIESSTLNGANVAIVTFTVTHTYQVGQTIRFIVPTITSTAYGMTQLNGVQADILAVGAADASGYTNTITVDVDVSAFGTFQWPLTTDPNGTPAQVVPVGENTSVANAASVNPFTDAENNQGYIGILLGAGVNGPAGQEGDVIYWVAGKSFNT